MIRFILNDRETRTDVSPGMTVLDFIRYEQHLVGTKIGCREGDCGACTILVGELKEGELRYRTMTSCLMPLANAHGKHIVTIEGVNNQLDRDGNNELNPIQHAMAEEGATQCGFCTPGFVMSLAGFCLSKNEPTYSNAVAAIDGNICRCTGYKSIERAAKKVATVLKEKKKILPDYLFTIRERLTVLLAGTDGELYQRPNPEFILGGGTDLYVQKHEEVSHAPSKFLFDHPQLKGIRKEGNKCIMGASTTVTDLANSSIIREAFPSFDKYAWLVSSTPIRNMATVAGNFVNASPIGDFTIFFLALDARIILTNGKDRRELPLRNFYKGYKKLDKKEDEYIESAWFELPPKNSKFNFEKVSKRTNLDIASVNTAISLQLNGDKIAKAGLSAGGVGPIPMYLKETSAFLEGKKIDATTIEEAINIARSEISPMSDARGSAEYKSFLLGQLIRAHFTEW